MARPGSSKAPQLSDPSAGICTRAVPGGRGGPPRNAGPEGQSRGLDPLTAPAAARAVGEEVAAPRTGRRRPEAPESTKEAPGLGAQCPRPPKAASSPLPSPMREKQGPRQCGNGEEVNPSCHCTWRSWKEHMSDGERPRPPLPWPLRPETPSRPRGPSPAPHQVVVLLIIAHEIIFHVRHLGRERGRGRRNWRQPPPTILRGSEASLPASPPRLPVTLRGVERFLPELTRSARRGFATAPKGSAPPPLPATQLAP